MNIRNVKKKENFLVHQKNKIKIKWRKRKSSFLLFGSYYVHAWKMQSWINKVIYFLYVLYFCFLLLNDLLKRHASLRISFPALLLRKHKKCAQKHWKISHPIFLSRLLYSFLYQTWERKVKMQAHTPLGFLISSLIKFQISHFY